MATAEELTEPLKPCLMWVPPLGPGVCTVCHSATFGDADTCLSCARMTSEVAWPLKHIVPVSLCTSDTESEFHRLLRRYKDGFPDQRADLSKQLAALVVRFVLGHRDCLEWQMGAFEQVVCVPSSRPTRPRPHPFEQVLGRTKLFRPLLVNEALELADPDVPTRQASDDRFRVRLTIPKRPTLLVDDACTSSANLQSAASALQMNGIPVVGALVAGRFIQERYSPVHADFVAMCRDREFDFDTCCVHAVDLGPVG